jgi:hypothetical protein
MTLGRVISVSVAAFLVGAGVVAFIHGMWGRGVLLVATGTFIAASLGAEHWMALRLRRTLAGPRGLGLLGVTIGAFFLIGALLIRDEPIAAAIMAASALLVLGVGLEGLLRARRLDRRP